jgi:histidine phosphotransferase ChpT
MSNDLAALVGSRICHDLISPIGAIGNGVELLSLTDGDTGAEMDLISESVNNANARIRYFRIAFGSASDDQSIGRAEVLSILAAVARGGRFTYFWQVEGDQPRNTVRCAFLMLLCLEAAMPMGGDIHINLEGDTWVLNAQGQRMKIDNALRAGLSMPQSDLTHTAAQVQFALLPIVLAEAGRALGLDLNPDRILARF